MLFTFKRRISTTQFNFIYFLERETESEQAGKRQREREGGRIPSRLCTVSAEPDMGLELTNHEIMT